ncbi:MAG TPA: hypothetical protein VNA12_07295 [Mycobacteriales bacterium]|nr:hypothetical protein [Mycobacteriales bacterium]
MTVALSRLLFFAAALVAALLLGRWLTRLTRSRGTWQRENFRGREISMVGGIVAVWLLGVVPAAVAMSDRAIGPDPAHLRRVVVAVAVVALAAGSIGVADDLYGDSHAKGFRGHLRALRHGTVTTGLLKVVVICGAAAAAAGVLGGWRFGVQQVVDTGVIAGFANLANLLDLRPGRALKVVVAAAVPAALVADSVVGLAAAWLAGAAAGLLPDDVGERTMLGDGGANALGGSLGVVLAATGGLLVSAAVLAGLVVVTAASEVISFSAVIDRSPLLRRVDELGRAR